MSTNKECNELLEVRLSVVQDGLQRLQVGMAKKLQHLEITLNSLSNVLLTNQKKPHNNHLCDGNDGGWQTISSKMEKLKFPHFVGHDLTEWFNCINQFFEFQNPSKFQKVALVSCYLEGESN